MSCVNGFARPKDSAIGLGSPKLRSWQMESDLAEDDGVEPRTAE